MIRSFHARGIMEPAELAAVKEWVPKVYTVFQYFKSVLLPQGLRWNPEQSGFAHTLVITKNKLNIKK